MRTPTLISFAPRRAHLQNHEPRQNPSKSSCVTSCRKGPGTLTVLAFEPAKALLGSGDVRAVEEQKGLVLPLSCPTVSRNYHDALLNDPMHYTVPATAALDN